MYICKSCNSLQQSSLVLCLSPLIPNHTWDVVILTFHFRMIFAQIRVERIWFNFLTAVNSRPIQHSLEHGENTNFDNILYFCTLHLAFFRLMGSLYCPRSTGVVRASFGARIFFSRDPKWAKLNSTNCTCPKGSNNVQIEDEKCLKISMYLSLW